MDAETDISRLFELFKKAGKSRINLCDDNNSKLFALQSFVDELLDQNELLIETVHDLQLVSRNRVEQLETRLISSAKSTEDCVLHLDKYEKALNAIVNECLSAGTDCDVVDELNNHITALKIENSYLRDQNENLQHDLDNVLKIVKLKKGANEGVGDCYNFCDSLNPEDVFGSIESMSISEKATEPSVVKTENRDAVEQCPTGLSKNVDPTVKLVIDEEIQVDIESPMTPSHVVAEEKQLLVTQLQEHLQNLVKESEMQNEVIKNLENKLFAKREECRNLKDKFDDLERKLNEKTNLNNELAARIDALNEDKRNLMTQMDEEREDFVKCREELKLSQKQASELKKHNDLQAMTIQHLRNAITDQVKVLMSQKSSNVHNGSRAGTESSNRISGQQDV